MKNEEIVRALRCVSTAGGKNACEHCPYWTEEEVPEEERPIYGANTRHSCDVDRVGLDGADLIERLTARCARYAEEIAVLQEREKWVPVTERLPEISNPWGVSDVVLSIISDPSGYPPPNPGLCVYLEDGRWTCHGRIVRVTHWRPLPDGPEVEENAETE